jgi:branched-chain amino acid transport system substrate-binding protein
MTRISSRRVRLLAGIGVVLMGLAACSSSSGGSGSGGSAGGSGSTAASSGSATGSAGGTPSAAGLLTQDQAGEQILAALGKLPVLTTETTRGITGKVIKVGSTTTDTKGGQHTQPGICDGAKARFTRANKEGGVNGYTFDFVGCKDDTAQPGVAQQNVQDLVEGQKVFAIVEYNSATGNLGNYFKDNNVPYFGALGVDYCGWADKIYAASISGESVCASSLPGKAVVNTASLTSILKATGKNPKDIKLALFSASDSYYRASMVNQVAAAKALGINVVYSATDLPSASEPQLADFTPVATKLIASGANTVMSIVTAPATLGTFAALKSNGYTGDLWWTGVSSSLMNDPGTAATMDGVVASTPNAALAFGDAPLAQITADMKAVGSTYAADQIGTLGSYTAADLFIQTLQKVSGPLTAEKMMNVLNQGGFTYKGIPGVSCDMSWPAGRVLSPGCSGVVKYDAAKKTIDSLLPLQNIGGYLIQPT